MSESRERRVTRKSGSPSKSEVKKNTSTRIEWARSLSNDQMDAVLQDALLKTRSTIPRVHDVILLEEVVHEIKSRLSRYYDVLGALPSEESEDED